MLNFLKKNILFFIPLTIVILDQVTKLWVKAALEYGQQIPVIKHYLMITYVENPGIAFGVSVGSFKVLLSIFTIIISIYLAYYIYNHKDASIKETIPLSLILGGALGNMIDRVFYGVIFGYDGLFKGKVIDYIMVDIPDITLFGRYYDYFPIFNIADSAVTVGVILLLIISFIPTQKEVN